MAEVTLKHLEYLVVAAEKGSVTGAANQLFLSQSAVSTALSDLESALGTQLFIRHARGLSLTAAGETVVLEAKRVLGTVDELRDTARSAEGDLQGRLRVGCYSTVAPVLLPAVIDEFLAKHPKVEITFVEGSNQTLEDELRSGRIDVAIMYHYEDRGSIPSSSEFSREPLSSSPPYLLLPKGHEKSGQEAVSLAEMVDEPLVLFDLAPAGDYFLALFKERGLSPNVRFRTTSYAMVRSLVARGLGYSLLSQRTASQASYEGLEYATAELAESFDGLDIDVVYISRLKLTRRVRAFINECKEVARSFQ
ncbi:LysR family transcriptional regulator [Micrococcoides hystricis]|uniref:LysR family transcriptional regulator n=1 Tax=Micrococcoides hystricis TaxID=1572761 RepID=A0ABV6P9Q9_9MICC